jgi:serine/threonine protein kinase
VVSVYQSNILDIERKKDEPMWIITQLISELTLESFVHKYKSEITFPKALFLTRQLLEIIQRCHKVNIFHRNLHPNNIIVQPSNDHASISETKIVLIDFGLAWFDSEELSITDEDDLEVLSEAIKRYSTNDLKDTLPNTFYALTQLWSLGKSQRCSSTVDTTGVCWILFWLLTDKWPDQVCPSSYPHHQNEYQEKIDIKLGTIANVLK